MQVWGGGTVPTLDIGVHEGMDSRYMCDKGRRSEVGVIVFGGCTNVEWLEQHHVCHLHIEDSCHYSLCYCVTIGTLTTVAVFVGTL